MRFFRAPTASAEKNIPPAVRERHAHSAVKRLAVDGLGLVAEIVFKEVHAPLGESFRVDVLVVVTGGVLSASKHARARVHTELQAFRVNVIGQRFHARGELLFIGNESAVLVAGFFRPAIVDNDVVVADFIQSFFHDDVSHFAHEILVDFLGERVPGIPAHRRS